MLTFKQFLEENREDFVGRYLDIGHNKDGIIWMYNIDTKEMKTSDAFDIHGWKTHSSLFDREDRSRSWKGRFDPTKRVITVVPPGSLLDQKGISGRLRIPAEVRSAIVKQFPGKNKIMAMHGAKI